MSKILVLGHARHGKDTFCECLAEISGLTFVSSSRFCLKKVVWPVLTRPGLTESFLDWLLLTGGHSFSAAYEIASIREKYSTPEECFEDRGAHRELWYNLIRWYNSSDPARLGREIFQENDIYCGLRSREEYEALARAVPVDCVIWVDAGKRLPPEGSSCTVTPRMADIIFDNNGTVDDLYSDVAGWWHGGN